MKKFFALFPFLQRKPKGYLLDGKYEIVPAFTLEGETYYMHKDPLNMLAGRGMTALAYMEELLMRCDVKYLRAHTEAMDQIFSDSKKIDLTKVIILNKNLKERVSLLAALPDHVYKLASVAFFTQNESPFKYDFKTGNEKVKKWKEAPGMYDFFLQTPLKDLIPSLALPDGNTKEYLEVLEKVNQMHLSFLQEVLSSPVSMQGSRN